MATTKENEIKNQCAYTHPSNNRSYMASTDTFQTQTHNRTIVQTHALCISEYYPEKDKRTITYTQLQQHEHVLEILLRSEFLHYPHSCPRHVLCPLSSSLSYVKQGNCVIGSIFCFILFYFIFWFGLFRFAKATLWSLLKTFGINANEACSSYQTRRGHCGISMSKI